MTFQFEPSGKIKPPTHEELIAADAAGETVIVIDRGTLEDGTPYWAYIAVKPSKYEEFMQLSKARQPKRIADYGAILTYGFDKDTPAATRMAMNEKYGLDENCEAKLAEAVKAARIDCLKREESQRIGDIIAMMKKKSPNS